MSENAGAETPQKVADETTEPTEEDAHGISQWEFLDRVPTREEVLDLLRTLPPVFGVYTVEYADYVQALPQTKKSKVPHPDPEKAASGVKVEKYLQAHTLYMSVAGRIKMAERAAMLNGWSLDYEPEPTTPTGIPGFLQNDERIVYREYAVFTQMQLPGMDPAVMNVEQRFARDARIGRKPGMAWVPKTGGSQAAGSNPYEKVETAARGRALAAWGFGVLPGSGVASLEEVTGAGRNRAAIDAEQAAGQGNRRNGGASRESRDDLIQRCLATAEELRQERGITEAEATDGMGRFLSERLGIRSVWDAEEHAIDWAKVKDGQIVLLTNSLTDALRKIRGSGLDV